MPDDIRDVRTPADTRDVRNYPQPDAVRDPRNPNVPIHNAADDPRNPRNTADERDNRDTRERYGNAGNPDDARNDARERYGNAADGRNDTYTAREKESYTKSDRHDADSPTDRFGTDKTSKSDKAKVGSYTSANRRCNSKVPITAANPNGTCDLFVADHQWSTNDKGEPDETRRGAPHSQHNSACKAYTDSDRPDYEGLGL